MKSYEKSRESLTTPTVNDKVVSLSALCSCANDQDAERSSARLPAPGGCGYLANHGVVLWECLTRDYFKNSPVKEAPPFPIPFWFIFREVNLVRFFFMSGRSKLVLPKIEHRFNQVQP